MAHPEQIEFCKRLKREFPDFFRYKLVLDIGSLDVNGNNRYLFENCTYLGVDVAPGNNVDFVSQGGALLLPDESIEVIISTECLEHDLFYPETLKNICRLLKPGGLFVMTCATEGRPEHGTSRSSPEAAPLLQNMSNWNDYYKNISEKDIRKIVDIEGIFKQAVFEVNQEAHDLYLYGFKLGELPDKKNLFYSENKSEVLLKEKDELLLEKDAALAKMEYDLAEKNKTLAENLFILSETQLRLEVVLNSKSWRYTRSFRMLAMAARKLKGSGITWINDVLGSARQ